MWVWRRMGKVSWMDKRTNGQVLSSMSEKRSLIKTIWDRKKNWIGHVVRGDGLMKLVQEGRMEGIDNQANAFACSNLDFMI